MEIEIIAREFNNPIEDLAVLKDSILTYFNKKGYHVDYCNNGFPTGKFKVILRHISQIESEEKATATTVAPFLKNFEVKDEN